MGFCSLLVSSRLIIIHVLAQTDTSTGFGFCFVFYRGTSMIVPLCSFGD